MTTRVANIRDPHEPDAVYIGRAGHSQDGYFGNPFALSAGEPRGSTIARFREYAQARFYADPVYRERVRGLRGKTLLCFCKPQACHGDVLAELAGQ